MSSSWRTVFSRSGTEVPKTAGDALKQLDTLMRERAEGRDEVAMLRREIAELRKALRVRTADRDEARATGEELITAAMTLEDERDAA